MGDGLKILMIAPQPFFSSRGTPLSVYYRTLMLSNLGHEIDLLTYPFGDDVEIKGVNIIRSHGLPFVYSVKIGPSISKLLLDIPLFFKALSLLIKNRYDLIYAHEEAVFFSIVFHLLFKTRYIYDMHSSLPQQIENFNFSAFRPIIKAFEFLERQSLSRASAVITICKELEEQVKKLGFGDKCILIENTLFYPIRLSRSLYDVNLKKIIKLKGKKVILYAGTFEPYQGLDMYLESIRIILDRYRRDDLLFVFLGGNPEQVLKMRTLAESLNIAEHTIFTGMLDVNLVKRFIREADVLVSPRLKGTNTPLKIYEYMASGVPIVATDLLTHTQELDHSSAFLRKPEPEDFAQGIIESIENRKDAMKKAKNAYKIYAQRYGEHVYGERLTMALSNIK